MPTQRTDDRVTLGDLKWSLGSAALTAAAVSLVLSQNAYVLIGTAIGSVSGVLAMRQGLRGASGLEMKVRSAVEQHRKSLVRQRRMLVRTDPYGSEVLENWNKEVARFVETVILPKLTRTEFDAATNMATLNTVLETYLFRPLAIAAHDTNARRSEFDPTMSPLAFEAHCVAVLSSVGWEATTTPMTGDQGADVLAEKSHHRVVLQVKLLATPVGNKAVQEAHAAKAHYDATAAGVVTNSGFTPSARQLAQSTGVFLLHHHDLLELEALLIDGDDATQELAHKLAMAGLMPISPR